MTAGRIVKLAGSVHVRSTSERLLDGGVQLNERELVSDQPGPDDIESTLELLKRVHGGDRMAVDMLVERCLPPLRRWAHGRLPQFARSDYNTEDLVQEGVNGFTFDPLNEEALAGLLCKMCSGQVALHRMGEMGRRKVADCRSLTSARGRSVLASVTFDGTSETPRRSRASASTYGCAIVNGNRC